MSHGPISKLVSSLDQTVSEARAENYAMINVRPGEKVSAMLDVLSGVMGSTPSALLTDALSERLAEYAVSSEKNVDAVLSAVEKTLTDIGHVQDNCALGKLMADGVIEIDADIVALRGLFKFASKDKEE